MIRQFFRDSLLYGASSVLAQGIPLLVLPVYVRLLTPTEYGALEILTVFAVLVNLTVPLEITQGFARHYPDAGSDRERHGYASTALWFTLLAYGLFIAAALLFSRPLTAVLLHEPSWEPALRIAAVAAGLNGIYLLLLNQLRWQLRPWAYAAASAAYVLISTGAGIGLILSLRTGVSGIFCGQIIGAAIAGWAAWFLGRRNYRFLFDKDKCLEMLSFSLPLLPSGISVLIAVYVDRFAIQNLMGLGDVGIYSAGFRVASMANVLMAGIYFSLTPLIYQNYRKERTPADIARIFTYFLCGTLPVLMGMALFSREILRLFTLPAYYGAWSVIPLLAVAAVCSKMYVFAPGLDIEKKTGRIALINIAAAAVNIALNLLLIPVLGIAGSAAATLISSAFLFSAYITAGRSLYPIPYDWRRIARACLPSAAVIATAYVEPGSTEGHPLLFAAAKLLMIGAASAWLIRSLNVRGARRPGES